MKKKYEVYYQIVGVDSNGIDFESPIKYKTKAKAIRKGLGLINQLSECRVLKRFIDKRTGLRMGMSLFVCEPNEFTLSPDELFSHIVERTFQFLEDKIHPTPFAPNSFDKEPRN